LVIDLKNTNRLTQLNDAYLTPYNGNNNGHIPPIQNNSILYYSVVQKISDEGEPLYDVDNGDEIDEEFITEKPIIDNIKSINTTEGWSYNKKVFSKKTKTISLTTLDFDEEGEYKGTRQLFTKLNNKKEKKGELIKENISYDFLFNPWFNEKDQCDSYFESSVIKKYLSYDLNDLADFEKNTILLALLKDIYNNKLSVYNLNNEKMSLDNFDTVFIEKYIYQTIDKEYGEPLYDKDGNPIVENKYNPIMLNDIIGFHFTEDWYTAKNDFNIIKEVKSLSFLVYDYSDEGEFLGVKKLPCIVKFKK
jgi:hypothetical protein